MKPFRKARVAVTLAVAALGLAAGLAQAQSTVLNCTAGCKAVTDPWPLGGVQPVTCKLFGAGATPISAAVVPGPSVVAGAPAASVACAVSFTLPASRTGAVTLTATAVSADGQESAAGAPFVFTATAGAPTPPAGLRATATPAP